MVNKKSTPSAKKKIQDALLKLAEGKSFTDITITDICKVAGVSRSVFYYHYDSIPAVLDSIRDSFLQYHQEVNARYGNHLRSKLVCMLDMIAENQAFFRLHFTNNQPMFQLDTLKEIVEERYFSFLTGNCSPNIKAHDVWQYKTHGAGFLVVNWLEGGCQEDSGHLADSILLLLNLNEYGNDVK